MLRSEPLCLPEIRPSNGQPGIQRDSRFFALRSPIREDRSAQGIARQSSCVDSGSTASAPGEAR